MGIAGRPILSFLGLPRFAEKDSVEEADSSARDLVEECLPQTMQTN